MISHNPEHADIMRVAGPLLMTMAILGFDPVKDVEKLNIDYDLYERAQVNAEGIYHEVSGASDILARLRDEVGAKWTGSAADQFDRYAEKVVVAGAAERGLVDAQHKVTAEFFKEIKKNVQDAHKAIMKAVAAIAYLHNPVSGLLVGVEQMVSGTGDFPEFALPTDVPALIEEAVKAVGAIVDLPKKFGEAKFDSTIGSLALKDTADFRIAPSHSEGAIPTGLDGNEKDRDAWKAR